MEEKLFELYIKKGSSLGKSDIDNCKDLPSYNTLCRKGYKLFELNTKFKKQLYEENPKKYIECGKPLLYSKDIDIRKFCDHSCAARNSNTRRGEQYKLQNESDIPLVTTCVVCNKAITSEKRYCNASCIAREKYNNFINEWLNGKQSGHTGKTFHISKHVKRYLRETRGTACSKCGWDEKHPIDGSVLTEIDHIDGDASNNRPENLRILCPNCHAMTPTFRARNSNSVRKR